MLVVELPVVGPADAHTCRSSPAAARATSAQTAASRDHRHRGSRDGGRAVALGAPPLPAQLPVLPLRDTVTFPDTLTPLAVGQERSVRLVNDVLGGDRQLVMVGSRRLRLRVLAADHHELAVARQHVVDELDRALLADRQRRQRVGERDGVAQRQHRQEVGHRRGAHLHRAGAVAERLDVDGHSPALPARWTATVRDGARRGAAIGSSTTSMPSS